VVVLLFGHVSSAIGAEFSVGNAAYSCVRSSSTSMVARTTTAGPNDLQSPLVTGVKSISVTRVGSGALGSGTVSIWDFTGGLVAIARCTPHGHRRVDLNLWPGDAQGD
jgi:hypothetical protein